MTSLLQHLLLPACYFLLLFINYTEVGQYNPFSFFTDNKVHVNLHFLSLILFFSRWKSRQVTLACTQENTIQTLNSTQTAPCVSLRLYSNDFEAKRLLKYALNKVISRKKLIKMSVYFQRATNEHIWSLCFHCFLLI